MAEPIRRVAPPVHRRPLGVRPQPRPRPIPWVRDETPASRGSQSEPTAPEPQAAQKTREPAHPASRSFQPVPERKLRGFLQTALGLHLAALLLPFMASAGSMPSLSDVLLASAVLLAGGAVLALGAAGRHG